MIYSKGETGRMPKINRIRIVNFTYNHESRHIVDESFDFHGGDDALLHLANGGGKSVLVQLFLQPIVPGAKIQGRNIASFFRKQRLPAYVMIEWKLDGEGGGFLLTGIGISSADAIEQEGKTRIRYFTFTSKYSSPNAYDVFHIPLVERQGELLEVKNFREARKIMADKARKDPYLVGYFPDDERIQYARHLAEFGISQDEWSHIIARINDSEHGLQDLFDKYKSSGQLLDDWIIKTVEKVMFKDRDGRQQLEEMLRSLVEEVVENERFIMEKQLFTDFLASFQEILDGLSALVTKLEEQNHLGENLAALYGYLGAEINTLRARQQTNEEAIEAGKTEAKKVDLEERSHQYYTRQEEHQQALEKLEQVALAFADTENNLTGSKHRGKIIEGARLFEETVDMNSKLSGIKEQLDMSKADYNADIRSRQLEYTLKIRYEQQMEQLAGELSDLQVRQKLQQEALEKGKTDQHELEENRSRLDLDQGKLEERLQTFAGQENKLQKQLGRNWIRNLLGELDVAEMEEIKDNLQKNREQVMAEYERLQGKKSALIQQQQEIDDHWKEIHAMREAAAMALQEYEREMDEYRSKEKEVQDILAAYGFDFSLIYESERLASLFKKHSKELEQNVETAARNKNEAAETLLSVKNNCLHTSAELISVLIDLDIPYDTGESYLRNQPPGIRQIMLNKNPMLPYTFIISRNDIDRLAQTEIRLALRRVVPLMTYEDLNLMLESQGKIARFQAEVAIACLFEDRIFDQDGMAGLIKETEIIQNEAAGRYEHYSQAYEQALIDFSICQRFDYTADYQYQLEKRINSEAAKQKDLKQTILDLEETKADSVQEQSELDRQAQDVWEKISPTEKSLQDFTDFLNREPEYQDCFGRLNQIKHDLTSLNNQKEILRNKVEKLQTDISTVRNQISQLEKQVGESAQRYALYKDATATAEEMAEGSIDELEQRLKSIKEKYNREIGHLEQQFEALTGQIRKTKRQLNKLELQEEEYTTVVFDEVELEAIHDKIIHLEAALKAKQEEKNEASRAEAAADNALANALDEVKRLGVGIPLPVQEIKGDFDGRRRLIQRQNTELERNNRSIGAELNRYGRIRENIEQTIDLAQVEPARNFTAESDVTAQAAHWDKDYRDLRDRNLNAAAKLKNRYDNCKIDFKDKNLNLDSIFKGVDPLWDKGRPEYDDYYFIFERMSQHGEKLADLILIYENQLANLERNKMDMAQQSYLQGRRLYEEIQSISEYSKVHLPGRSRLVQMLKIDLQFDDHESARQRIKDYIEECIVKVREKTRQENRDDELRKTVARLISSRELLNVYLGNAHIPVYVYKIDMNMQNSRLKSWEDAVRENSGAERFVVFFAMLSSLMTYTRVRNMETVGADPDTGTRVIIMDNPFGPISSEHLLEPMFEIAKKHQTQLICLTHLKDHSIMKCFNLIYMLKVRMGAVGGSEYLKAEEFVRDRSALTSDEKLEKAIYRASEFKEMSLFEDD